MNNTDNAATMWSNARHGPRSLTRILGLFDVLGEEAGRAQPG